LEQQSVLARVGVADFGDTVSGAADLDDVLLNLNTSEQTLLADIVPLPFSLLFCSTTCQVGLVLPSLCVGEIRAVVLVDRQAKTALEATDVVLEEVRVLVEVDGLERELSETFSSVGVRRRLRGDTTAAELGTCAIL
jgi:hypothetical protein